MKKFIEVSDELIILEDVAIVGAFEDNGTTFKIAYKNGKKVIQFRQILKTHDMKLTKSIFDDFVMIWSNMPIEILREKIVDIITSD